MSLIKLNILLLYGPAIILLGMYLKELKMYVPTKKKTQNCIWMFIPVLFMIAKTWMQSRCPIVKEKDKLLFL